MSAPNSNPSQNPLNPFPAWRLKNGVMNATEKELGESSEACERWGWRCAALLVAGLCAEFIIAAFHPTYDSFWGRWGPPLATLLVVIGVAGEVQFGRMGSRRQSELRRRTEEQLAEALRMAHEAWTEADKAGDSAYRAERLAEDALGIPPPWERLK